MAEQIRNVAAPKAIGVAPPIGLIDATVRPSGKILLTAEEVHDLTGWGRGKIYEMMARDLLPVVRVGKRVRVHWPTFSKWLEDQASTFDGDRLRDFLAA